MSNVIRWLPLLLLPMCLVLLTGCAIQYFDAATGTEHLWGIGHMRMKVGQPTGGVRAIVTGTDTLGVTAGSVASTRRLTIGWERIAQMQVISEDTALILEWPSADLFSVRVGTELPPYLKKDSDDQQQQKP